MDIDNYLQLSWLESLSYMILMLLVAFYSWAFGLAYLREKKGANKTPLTVLWFGRPTQTNEWELSYASYRLRVWAFVLLAWAVAAWHLLLAGLWAATLVLALTSS